LNIGSVEFWWVNLVVGKFLVGTNWFSARFWWEQLVFGRFLVGHLVFGKFLVGKFDLRHVSGWKTLALLEVLVGTFGFR
jgi:hypothetical protein